MTEQTLYERIYAECEEEHLDQIAIKAICDEYDKRIADLERTNELLSRSVLPDRHWAAPLWADMAMRSAGKCFISEGDYIAMRDNYLERRK